ncbi:MAG: helix-turn-helix transcriptional regulator [Tenericutes bacterium]|nr:helix-turn-helix transcriptional regulator [Mycoplasmatota bacterium]
MKKISEHIKKYRKKHNLSQSEFAVRLHVTKQAVSKWETGRGYPDSSLIPVIAKELGISIDSFMGEKRIKSRMIVISIISTIFIIALIILFPVIKNYFQEIREYNNFKDNIENTIELDLPEDGSLVNAEFEDWIMFGNAIPINRMSYLVFSNENQIETFENGLVTDSRWVTFLDEDQLELMPAAIFDYSSIGNYYLFYNVDTSSLLDSSVNDGIYHILFLIYQKDNNRLIVFDYSIYIEGGN